MAVSRNIVENIRESKILNCLKRKGVVKKDDEKGMELALWLSKVIEEERVTVEYINSCLWDELMFGNRRLVRCYELQAIRKIKREIDWVNFLHEYNCPSMNFNRIVQTVLNYEDNVKVCAMNTDINDGVIQKISILFVFNMCIRGEVGEKKCYSFIPVTINLVDKILTMKVRNKEEAIEGSTPNEQLDDILKRLLGKLEFDTKCISVDTQKTLYRMSKVLFDDFFKQLPNIAEVEAKKKTIPVLVNSLLENVTLLNQEEQNGLKTINKQVIDVEDEMYKLLQQVALYDYLKDNEIKILLQNTDRYISRIRFSDRDNLTASLTSETGVKCIFDAKTFMCVRNSLDLVERIVSIVVSFVSNSGKGIMSVKYDASDKRYLCIHILNNRYYSEEDFNKIWELYREYESKDNTKTSFISIEDNVAAM